MSIAISNNTMKKIRNWETRTGRKASSSVIQGLAAGELEARSGRALEAERLGTQKSQFNESLTQRKKEFATQTSANEKAQKDSASAAKVSGAVDIVSTGIQGYAGYKYLAKKGAEKAIVGAGSGTVSGGAGAGTVGGGTALSGAGVGEAAISGAATSGGGTGAATAGAEVSATGVGVGTVAAAVGYGAVGYTVGDKVFGGDNGLIGKGKTTNRIGKNATAGAAFGSAFGPVGTLVGGVLGGVVGLVGDISTDSILCTAMLEEGGISKRTHLLSGIYKRKYVDRETYIGYLKLARPLVGIVKNGGWKSRIVISIFKHWSFSMANSIDPKRKKDFLGSIILYVGTPICRRLGKKHNLARRCTNG